jgi:pre-60S factor REI1
MRSDWHRYNLKRRVASLPPLSSEVFAEKVLSAQATSSAAAAKASFEKTCIACQRTYYSENAYQNHLGSQKHRVKAAALEANGNADTETASVMSSTISLGEPIDNSVPEDINDPEVEVEFSKVIQDMKDAKIDGDPLSRRPTRPHHSSNEDRPDDSSVSTATNPKESQLGPLSLNRCLFCNYDSPNLKLNILHMTKFHGLFIPEQPYLIDLEGLITYLGAKITENHECLFCHKLKGSTSGVQTHMRDKGHCMIAFSTEEEMLEVGQFYDFRSTYSDEEDDDEEDEENNGVSTNHGVKLGARRTSKGTKDDEADEGWETDSDDSIATDEITSVPIDHDYHRLAHHRHHTHSDPRSHRAPDGFHSHAHSHHAAFYSDYELHLPSGRSVGHRSLARYYRQNLHDHPSPEERAQRLLTEGSESEADKKENGRSRQIMRRSEMGMTGVTDAKRKEATAIQKRAQRNSDRAERQYQWGIQRKANNQKHFRDDNFGTHV